VEYAASVPLAVAALVGQAKDGDVIVTLGAGSVSQAGALLLEGLGANG
jgi:UDP-N-acetylmuramate--alanine ligase